MKTQKILSALLVAMLALAQGSAFAQPGKGNNGRNGNSEHCGNGDRGCERAPMHGDERDHGNNGRGDQGAGPNHAYYRGDRLPYNDRGRQYVVDDWHGHGLRSPPRGYHWVQSGGDYVLVAIATGVILDLLLSR